MADISLTEISVNWDEGTSLAKSGRFHYALTKFITLNESREYWQLVTTPGRSLFNIGQMYFALRKLDHAAQVNRKFDRRPVKTTALSPHVLKGKK